MIYVRCLRVLPRRLNKLLDATCGRVERIVMGSRAFQGGDSEPHLIMASQLGEASFKVACLYRCSGKSIATDEFQTLKI